MNFLDRPSFIIKTLGCKVNQYETQAMRENLIKNNFIEKKADEMADFYIINSCTVTEKADKDTRNLIHHFHRLNPSAQIVVAGCYAELDKDRKILMKMPGIAYLVRNNEKRRIIEMLSKNSKFQILNSKFQITNFEDRNRAFIKIQDGCNHRCSYCKVNIVRGPSRSRDAEEILGEIKTILEKGFKEIVLTGVCLGAWGKDLKEKMDLADLLVKISNIKDTFRIRLSSIEPIYVDDKLIDFLQENTRMCKHLHIPIQSGDNKVLKLMKRPYNAKKIKKLIGKIRKHIPDIAITTDMLVGFPGESNKQFLNTLKFIKDVKPSRLHVFSYSKREGTKAAKYKQYLDKEAIQERARILVDLSNKLSLNFAKNFIDKDESAIIENFRDRSTNLLTGYTDRYIRVLVDGPDLFKNKLISVKIVGVDENKNTVKAEAVGIDYMQII